MKGRGQFGKGSVEKEYGERESRRATAPRGRLFDYQGPSVFAEPSTRHVRVEGARNMPFYQTNPPILDPNIVDLSGLIR